MSAALKCLCLLALAAPSEASAQTMPSSTVAAAATISITTRLTTTSIASTETAAATTSTVATSTVATSTVATSTVAASTVAASTETSTTKTTTTVVASTETSMAALASGAVASSEMSALTLPVAGVKSTETPVPTTSIIATSTETSLSDKGTTPRKNHAASTTTATTPIASAMQDGDVAEALTTVEGSVTLSVSSAAVAAQLAEDSRVAEDWRAALARAAGVAVESVQLTISVASRRRLGSMRGLRETARLSLRYVITLPTAPVGAPRRAPARQVVASIESISEEELTTALAEVAREATGRGDVGLVVQAIGDPTEVVHLQSVTRTETFTSATESQPGSVAGVPGAVLVVVVVLLVGAAWHTRCYCRD